MKIMAAHRLIVAATKDKTIADLQSAGLNPADAKQAADLSGSPGGVEVKEAVGKKAMKFLLANGYKRTESEKHEGGFTQDWLAKGKSKIYFEGGNGQMLIQIEA